MLLPVVLAVVGTPLPIAGQAASEAQVDSLRREVARLTAQLDSLRELLLERKPTAQQSREDALARLRAAAQAAASEASADSVRPQEGTRFVGRQRSLQSLNPEISLTGDLFGSVSNAGESVDNFIPREFELSIQSSLDPFSLAKIFLTREVEGGGLEVFADGGAEEGEQEGGGVELEEGYLEWRNLPGGFGVKFGRFFQQLGQLNRWHGHALPFQSRSLPHLAFVGEESLTQAGISVHWLVPAHGFGTWETTVEVTRSENEALFGESARLSYLGHLNTFWQLSEATDLDLGFTAVWGDHVGEDEKYGQRLYAVEGAFNWIPPGRARYRGVTLRGGFMLQDPERRGGVVNPDAAKGFWGLGELKIARQWILGGRYDWVEDPADTSRTAWLASPALTWWQSEFVRLRAEYDFLHNPDETRKQFTLRVTFAMGPHRHEAY